MMKNLNTSSVLVVVLCAALTSLCWAIINKKYEAPAWPEQVSGLAYSPYQSGQDNLGGPQPDIHQIDRDLALLANLTDSIRTYSTAGVFSEIPALAAQHELSVMLGAWLDNEPYSNAQELNQVIHLSKLDNVSHVLIGNEVLLRQNLSVDELIDFLDQARTAIEKPVSTAETWSTWLQYPQLAEHVDFIAVHILPYWEGIAVDQALDFTLQRLHLLQQSYPELPIVITEVGWPSEGRTRGNAVSSGANQALFLRHFLDYARQHDELDYFLMEAFDQPWKRRDEGAVGAHWGIFDVDRQSKFAFDGLIEEAPAWKSFMVISVLLGILILIPFLRVSATLTPSGKTVLSLITYGLLGLIIFLLSDYVTLYMTYSSILTGVVLLGMMLGICLLILSEAHEWAEAHWFSHRRRALNIQAIQRDGFSPMVSIHVPAYNEPPSMLIQTLNALAKLDYDNFEVIVIDNNTQDEACWQPVAQHCEMLGSRFHFHHQNPLSGFKAGALNYALEHSSKTAEIIAVIDSDYVVDPQWLNELVPAFQEKNIAIVQAPQDYRDQEQSVFKGMCNAEYQGFFKLGMITRNERNAIIQHGTMTMIRRRVLEEVGGWAHWCITEDAELGLRIFQHGYEARYTPQSYGRGLTPDTFLDYKKQRYRWAYGAMQILKRNWRELLLGKNCQLSPGQRYHFIAGWLPWLAQSANLFFSILSIFWSLGMIIAPNHFEVPHLAFSIFPILFFVFNLSKLIHLYLARLKTGFMATLGAGIAGLSLSYTIGKAMLAGLFTGDQPFIRTPKLAHPHVLSIAIASAFEEILILLCYILVISILLNLPYVYSPDYMLWISLLVVQSIPFAAALLSSLIGAWPASTPSHQKSLNQNSFEVEINKNL